MLHFFCTHAPLRYHYASHLFAKPQAVSSYVRCPVMLGNQISKLLMSPSQILPSYIELIKVPGKFAGPLEIPHLLDYKVPYHNRCFPVSKGQLLKSTVFAQCTYSTRLFRCQLGNKDYCSHLEKECFMFFYLKVNQILYKSCRNKVAMTTHELYFKIIYLC